MKLNNLGNNKAELVTNSGSTVLFSYNTPVAALHEGNYYRTNEFYSVTTSKHINQWLDGVKAEEKSPEFFEKLV